MTASTIALLLINSFIVAATLLSFCLPPIRGEDAISLSEEERIGTSVPTSANISILKLRNLNMSNWDNIIEEAKNVFGQNDTKGADKGSSSTFAASNRDVSQTSYLDPNGPKVQFLLFQRNWKLPYNFKPQVQGDFKQSQLNISNPTKIIVHGFSSSIREDVFTLNRDAYLSMGNYNVIGMDWSVLCEFEYFTAMRGAQIAGATLGAFINWLVKEGVQYKDIHLIGHSLGAHVAAMSAYKVQGGKVGRITGLDPAAPGYTSEVSEKYRLDPGDAVLVDVIHTNVRVLSLAEPQGHLDFYPNGGRFQPGCPDMYDIWTLGDSVECNHGRAYRYFPESITNKQAFRSYRCKSVQDAILNKCSVLTDVYMGKEETYVPGIYYLRTAAQLPFAII